MAGISLTAIASAVSGIVPLWRFESALPTVMDWQDVTYAPPNQVYMQKFSVGNQTIADEGESVANWTQHFPTMSNVDNCTLTMIENGGVYSNGTPIPSVTANTVQNTGDTFTTSSGVNRPVLSVTAPGVTTSANPSYWSGLAYWTAWQSRAHDDDGNFGLPADYWKTVSLWSLDTQGNPIARFDVLQAWPTSVSNFDFDGEASQAVYLTVTLACTRVRFTRLSAGQR